MVWLYIFCAVFLISSISLVGIFTFSIKKDRLKKILVYLVSLSVGTLIGDAFIHLIPEAYEKSSSEITVSLMILFGIIGFFVIEHFIHWRHCHEVACDDHPHKISQMIIIGDGVHNFIDGMIIAGSFLASIPLGIATTIAVIFHEIPQEIGNFGSMIYDGYSRRKALWYNFISALTAMLGAFLVFVFESKADFLIDYLIPFAAGGFIYIAVADLIPELHKLPKTRKSLFQLFFIFIGIGIMLVLL